MQDVEHVKCGAMSCVKCVMVRCINDVANIWRDLKCGVEHMECGVMRYVSNVKMGCSARCGAMHNMADMVRFEIW